MIDKIKVIVKYNQTLNYIIVEDENSLEIISEFGTRSTNGIFGNVERFLSPTNTEPLKKVLMGMDRYFYKLHQYVVVATVMEREKKLSTGTNIAKWREREIDNVNKKILDKMANIKNLEDVFELEIVNIQNLE